MKKYIRYIPVILAVAVLLGSCTNMMAPPEVREAVPAGKGRVTIQLGDSARTALPGDLSFTSYTLRFEYTGGAGGYNHDPVVNWNEGEAVDLEAGPWTITLDAYSGNVVSGTGSAVVTVGAGTDTFVPLRIGPKTDDPNITGTLRYTVSYPTGASYGEQTLYVYNMAGTFVTDYSITNEEVENKTLPAGVYRIRAVVKNTSQNTTASAATVAHVYGNKVTSVVFNFDNDDFTAYIPLTVTADLDVPDSVAVTRRIVGVYSNTECTFELDNKVISISPPDGEADVTLWIPPMYAEVYLRQDIQVGTDTYEGKPQKVEITDPGQPFFVESFSDIYYNVGIDPLISHGTVTPGRPIARADTIVTLAVEPDTDSVLTNESLTYSYEDIPLRIYTINGVYSFSMPNVPVTVSAEFIQFVRYGRAGRTGDGLSWETASDDVQRMMDELAALSANYAVDYSGPYIVKLGAGTYKPKYEPMIPANPAALEGYAYNEPPVNAGDKAFILREGVQVWGGYSALGGEDTVWNVTANKTTLSGDLNDNNTTDTGDAYHVVLVVDIDANSGAVLDGLTISGGNAKGDSSSLDMGSGINIRRNFGGGIYSHNASPDLVNVTISGNAASSNGGGMYNDNSSLTLDNVTIGGTSVADQNTATDGGGIYNMGGSTLNINGVMNISGNIAANNGGGIYNYNSPLTLNSNVTISENEATNNYGGGVYFSGTGTFSMSGGIISDNTANGTYGNGGGVYFNGSETFAMSAGTISGNTATNNGGGVYVNGGTFTKTNGTIYGSNEGELKNTAGEDGHAVWVVDGSKKRNDTAGADVSLYSNTPGSAGGWYVSPTSSAGIQERINAAESGDTITLAAGTYIMENDPVEINNKTITITTESNMLVTLLRNSDFTGNMIEVTGSGSLTLQAASMGSLILDGNNVTDVTGSLVNVVSGNLTIEAGATLRKNKKTGNGGGVYFAGTNFNMSGGIISDNNATNSPHSGFGSGVYFAGTNFNMSGGTISGNNGLNSVNGGGVYVAAGTFKMSDAAEISDNRATSGGGVYVSIGTTFTMSGGTISGHSADFGGGVCVFDGSFTMTGGNINGNTVGGVSNGGGVYVQNGEFTMSGGTIGGAATNANTAINGGGVYVSIDGTFTMSGTAEINGNKAITNSGIGGGVFVEAGTFEISGTTAKISGNTATNGGGGVYFNSSDKIFTMSGGIISGNEATTASSTGGGVYVKAGTFTKTGGTIYGSNETAIDENGKNLKNTAASGSGHAVYVFDDTTPPTRNLTAGPQVSLNSREPTILGGWEFFTFSGIQDAITRLNDTNGGTLTLPGGTTYNMTGPLSVNQNITITTEPGAEVTLRRGHNGDMITVTGNSGKLTLRAEKEEANGSLTLDGGNSSSSSYSANGPLVKVTNGGYLTIEDGAILQNNKNENADSNSGGYGGGVHFDGTKFTMTGGTISNNTNGSGNSGYGGGVYVKNGEFNMEGGTISNNTATANGSNPGYGGGVNVANGGTFKMSGGEIRGNKATGANGRGGGVYASGTFKKEPDASSTDSGIIYGNDSTSNENTAGASSYGHAVYKGSSPSQYRDTTLGTSDNISTGVGELENWQ